MNTRRIRLAVDRIEERQKALKWLEEHGVKLDCRDDVLVGIDVLVAGSVDGSKEATKVMESYAKLAMPDVIKSAIACCRNDIQMETDAIRAELEGAA